MGFNSGFKGLKTSDSILAKWRSLSYWVEWGYQSSEDRNIRSRATNTST